MIVVTKEVDIVSIAVSTNTKVNYPTVKFLEFPDFG